MPDRVLLDTGVLIGRAVPRSPGDAVSVSALTLAELEFGLSAAAVRDDAIEVRRRATRLAAIRVEFGDGVPFDAAAAVAYGSVTSAVLQAGRSPRARAVGLLIAAVALSRGAALLTTQPDEFRGLGHLIEVRTA